LFDALPGVPIWAVGDKGYDSAWFRDVVRNLGSNPAVPARKSPVSQSRFCGHVLSVRKKTKNIPSRRHFIRRGRAISIIIAGRQAPMDAHGRVVDSK
jgi:hypothetical protein